MRPATIYVSFVQAAEAQMGNSHKIVPLHITDGLTSVKLVPYITGSFLGMLPGTYAYVSAGHVGKAVLKGGDGSLSIEMWQVRASCHIK